MSLLTVTTYHEPADRTTAVSVGDETAWIVQRYPDTSGARAKEEIDAAFALKAKEHQECGCAMCLEELAAYRGRKARSP